MTSSHRVDPAPVGALTVDHLVAWMHAFDAHVVAAAPHLTALDSAIGDADHGTNMARGMAAVGAALREAPETVESFGRTVGMALVSAVGGSSGPLYGTFFLRLGAAAGAVAELPPLAVATALRAAVDGVRARGKAEVGDKTLIDALAPAVDALDAALADGADLAPALRAARDAARLGRDATAALVARKGRASYVGERARGHVDPGAASAAMLLESLLEVVEELA